jgi:TolB-like protein/tetratricopeptide (TPR) repeat protein
MSSIIAGYNYDIFISYRQKDNKGDRWVSEFVETLKTELESTFKEEISVYFDINPHDGLLETHDVDASLKDKLKCLVFIPIISRTYCDSKSFAWEHEFKAFVEQASNDQFGLKVKLPNGNVASRVLPIQIYDLDTPDIKLCESVLGGLLRGVEFIYKSAGVNRPLNHSDNPEKNLNKTYYRDQINKVANSIKEIISGLKKEPIESISERKENSLLEDKPPIKEKSIIVLPFENISPDPDQEYFSDGLTEEIITDLSHVHDLLVISRSSAMTFKGTKKTIPEIAQTVNVRYVLEGSVRKFGNNLRITAQLIDSSTDLHLWADKFSGTLDDVFEMQEKVSRVIVERLKVHLTPEETKKIAEKSITDLKAYECYLRATSALERATEDGVKEAIRNLELAVQIVGENVLLYYGLGFAYWWFANLGISIEENLKICKEYAGKAISIDPMSTRAKALYWFAGINYQDNQHLREAQLHLKEVLERDSNEPLALLGLLCIYIWAGQVSEGMTIYRRYAEREPIAFYTYVMPFFICLADGKFDAALEEYRRGLKAIAYAPSWKSYYPWALAWVGRTEEAIAEADLNAKNTPDAVHTKLALVLKHCLQGDVGSALDLLTKQFYDWCYGECTWSYFISVAFALADAKQYSMDWLEHSIDLGWINYPLLAVKDPLLANIRNEARFKKLLQRVKYEWENFEV